MSSNRAGNQARIEARQQASVAKLPIFVTTQCRVEPAERIELRTADGDMPGQQVLERDAVPGLADVDQHHRPPTADDGLKKRRPVEDHRKIADANQRSAITMELRVCRESPRTGLHIVVEKEQHPSGGDSSPGVAGRCRAAVVPLDDGERVGELQLTQGLDRPIGRAVVNDDHLESRSRGVDGERAQQSSY
jgi:hypothetical protein